MPIPHDDDRPGALLLELSPVTFNQWRHHPVTTAFLAFLGDQAENHREAFIAMWESGTIERQRGNPELSPDYLRGRVVALSELQRITIEDIKAFYRDSVTVESQDE